MDRPPEEISSFERSSHFYERERERRDGDAYLRRPASTYHVAPTEPLRGRTRDRLYRNGPYTPIIESVVSRQQPHHRSVGSSWSYEAPASRYPTASTTPDVVYPEERREPTAVVVLHKKHTKSRSGSNGSETGSNSGSSGSRSRSSSSSSQSASSSCSSASSSPVSDKSCSTHSHHGSLRSGVTLQSAVSTPHTNNSSPAVHSDDRRPLAICVRNLPARSSDTSLKDGLFHEYKKHGKVTWVKVVGQGAERYALVCFKKPEDVEKALQVSHDKLFFGCKIEVGPYQGYDVDDNEFRPYEKNLSVHRPYEAEQDEFHPKATRTLFIGNLEKDITAPELRKHFDQFGEIIEIDIKKQGSASSYAFCQYCDIGSVVRAMRTLDGEHLGNNRIKLGFGKSMHTNCVWVDGVSESVSEKYLSLQFSQFGPVSHVAIDRSRGHALVFFEQIAFAQVAVKEMRGVALRGRKLQVDFASRECQEAFYDHLEKQTGHTVFDNSVQASPQAIVNAVSATTRGFETPSSSSSSSGGGSTRYNATSLRYTPQQQPPRSTGLYPRAPSNSGASPGASTPSPSTPIRTTPRHQMSSRFEFTNEYSTERRPYRSYEDVGLDDGGGLVMVTVGQGPPDIRHLQKERNALLEQLEDCASSGEEGGPRRRCKHRRSHSGEGGGGGSRPGTPLCDERPENLLPLEPRRTPRERPPDPLSLPLPRFASQVLSPRPAPPSPPASPPRPQSSSSDDSEPSPPSPEWEERLRSLDEKYEKWSGSRTALTKVDASALRIRHKLLDLDLHELQPSDIVKSVLAKRSVFDEDSKRLENFGEKYEPREFIPSRPGITALRSRLDSSSPLHSPVPKSPASSPAGGAKGLQYPFPSHPPVQPTTSVATTTAAMSLVSCAGVGSLAITTATCTIPSIEISKAPQTYPTSCISTVTTVRQFPLPSLSNYLPPKISPPPPSDKKVDTSETSPRGLIASTEKSKSVQKSPSPSFIKGEKCDSVKKEVVCNKQLKPCSRRESTEERKEGDGRRRSREETVEIKANSIIKETASEKDKDLCERRKSVSDKRRDSVESSQKEISDSVSVSDKSRDSNHKEERRRKGSVDNSARRDSESNVSKLSELKRDCNSEQSEVFECTRLTGVDSVNKPNERRKDSDDNSKNNTDFVDKKNESFITYSERDRRRNRDSVDSCSDTSRNRKVPESIDKHKELEADLRHNDISAHDKKDDETKKVTEHQDRRKDIAHNDSIRNNEISSERRREKDSFEVSHRERKEHSSKKDKEIFEHLENVRHKSNARKSPEVLENARHKENDRRKIIPNDNSRHRDTNARKDSESSEDHSQKLVEHKKDSDYGFNSRHRDNSRRKETESSEFSMSLQIKRELDHHSKREFDHSQSKKEFDQSDNLRHKDLGHKKDLENQSLFRNRDIDKKKEPDYYDNSRQKETDKPKDSEIVNLFQVKEIEVKKEYDSFEVNKSSDFEGRKSQIGDHSRCKDSEKQYESHSEINKMKFDERKQDADGLDVRLKEFESKKEFDSSDYRHRESERRKDNENVDNMKFWDGEKKKDSDIDSFKTKDHKHSEIKKDLDVDMGKIREYERRKDLLLQMPENCRHRDVEKRKESENLENSKREDKRRDFEIPDILRHRENDRKKVDNSENAKYLDRKKDSDISEIFRRKESEKKKDDIVNDSLRFRDCERRKEFDPQDNIRHRDLLEKRRESSEKDRRKERESLEGNSEVQKSRESNDERRKDRDNEREKLEKPKRSKDYESQDKQKDTLIESSDKRKESIENCDRKPFDSIDKYSETSNVDEFERKTESIKKEKRKDRISSSSWPAAIGCKRRLSSQDSLDICIDEAKRVKPERRDSKDSGRSSCSSSKRSSGEKHNKTFTKMLEEKIREDRERELHRKKKEEEVNLEEKVAKSLQRKDKRNSSEKRKEERKVKPRPKENGTTASESELGSGDDEGKLSKRHSIFDIVDDEPAYISMYDKVKARSTKNMQKQEEEKRQERLKEKFSQLKQSRAKREEKKRSTSYDEDSDSERGGGRRSNKLMITSSEEDAGSENDTRTKSRKIMSDTSEDDTHRHGISRIKPLRIHSEDVEPKPRKIMSDTSEDDTLRLSISRIKSSRLHSEDLETKPRKILSDTSEDDMLRHISRNKTSRIHSDESEVDMGFEDQSKVTEVELNPKLKTDSVTDLFSNVSEDNEQFPDNQLVQNSQSPETSFHRNSIDNSIVCQVTRKKSHKKKQKRQKNCEGGEDGFSNKRHVSKKDRRKSTHSRDGEEDGKSSQGKIRKKKSDRENAVKRDEKMEDIFGTLSDDSDKGQSKWHVSEIYGSDSDSDREITRKRDKRRRERKARELDEAGRALEAKLLETSDNYALPEEQPVTKIKKKKRKKSRDEKSSKHHQHRFAEEEEATLAAEADSEREPEPPVLQPSLPRLMDSPPPPTSNQNKKPDIPGFGSQVDENIHETAVKSISESPTKIVEEKAKPIEPILSTQSEDKPTPVISQEETEDAVAALLLEDSFGGGFESYPNEETPKPDTPVSEPDLQIDTDTEDTFDPIDFSKPPRTPDIPTSFYRQHDTREGLEERILALACPDATSKPEPSKHTEGTSNNDDQESQDLQKEIKVNTDNKKIISSLKVQQELSNVQDERTLSLNKFNDNISTQSIETGKRHDLPPLIRQNEISHVVHPVKHNLSELKTVHETKLAISKPQAVEQHLLKPLVMTATTKPFISSNPPPLTQRKPQFGDNKMTPSTTNVRFATCLTLKPTSVMAPLNVNVQQPLFQSHQIIQQSNNVKQPSPNQQTKLSPLLQQPKLNQTVIQGSKVNAHQHQVQLKVISPVVQQHSPKVSPLVQEPQKSSLSPVQQPQNITLQLNSVPHSQPSNISFSHDRQNLVKSPKPLNINVQQSEKPNTSHPSSHQITTTASLIQSPKLNFIQNQQSNTHTTLLQPANSHVISKQNQQSNLNVTSNLQQPSTVSQLESSNISHGQPSNLAYRKTVLNAQHGNNNLQHNEPSKIIEQTKMPVSEASTITPTTEQSKSAEQTNLFLMHSEKAKDFKELSNISFSQQASVNCVDNKNVINAQYAQKQFENVQQEVKIPTSVPQKEPLVNKSQPMELKTSLSHYHDQKPVIQQTHQKFSLSPIQNCVLTAHSTHAQILKPAVPLARPQIANISTSNLQNITPVKQPTSLANKPNAMTSTEQPVTTVISQSVTSPQIPPVQQVIQKTNVAPFIREMIRPPNAPQPQTVHTLRNDIIEKSKIDLIKPAVTQSLKNETFNSLVTPLMSHVIQPTKQSNLAEEIKPSKIDTDELQKKNTVLENHIEPVKIVQVENKITKPIVDDMKPMNAFIQDLTLKAAAVKQTAGVCGKLDDELKKETLKPIEQVVQLIHERIRSSNSESKDTEKLNATETTLEESKEVIKPVTEINIEKTSDDEIQEAQLTSEIGDKFDTSVPIKSEQNQEQNSIPEKDNAVAVVNKEIPDRTDKDNPKVDLKTSNTPLIEEPKVDKIIIKKEDTGLCVDAVVTPLTPKMEKSNVFVSPGESSCEPKEQERATFDKQAADIQSPEIKDEKVSSDETLVAPTRGGRAGRRKKAGNRAGGVVTRRSRLNNKTITTNKSATADVYEFRDDSEEESRPRLILTIKSPPEQPIVQTTSPASNTRKSRRLQEKDGSRNTVDDTIEDVIRGTRNSGRRTTRAATAASATTVVLETRRSPRRKQAHPPLPKDLMNEVKPLQPEIPQEVIVSSSLLVPTSQPPATVTATLPTVPQPITSILKPSPAVPTEPMTLIDPVTGLLIPMRESEEGQYIPVSTDHVRVMPETHDENGEPAEKRMKPSNPVSDTIITAVPKPVSATLPQVNTAPTPLPVRPGLPSKMPLNCAVVTPLPSKTNPIISKPNNLSDLVRPVLQQSKPISPLPTTAKPIVPPRTSTTIVTPTALTKPLSITPTSMVKPTSGIITSSPGGAKSSPLVNSPIPLNRVVGPPPLSTVNKSVVSHVQTGGTTISAVPINHKTHLLQAVTHRGKVPVAKVPTPLTPKAHILQSIGNAANCGAREGVVGPGTPPPPHHGALLTGSVASPPLRAPHHVSQQPIVTGASSSRVVCKSLLEPLKVEPGAPGNAGCIVVPTPSPQPRGQVMQAGLPVPAYEASLGDVVQHVNYAPHHMQPVLATSPHYVHSQIMYQQYLREAALGGYHLPSGVKPGVDIEEGARGAGASPPLELRRGSPHDRTTDSPQVATLYVHGARHLYYEGPPPAHRPSQPRIQVSTPPHASQVPPQADSLLMLLQRYPVMWQGLLALKTDQAAVQMHFVFGNPHVARDSLPCNSDGSTPPLRIVQRMRLEQTQVDGVARKMQMDNEHCMLLALPCGRDHMDVLQQSNNLQSGFITYLQQKQAAGIVNIAAPGSKQAAYVVHIFPACDFANESLARIAPDLLHRVADISHLLIVIATV